MPVKPKAPRKTLNHDQTNEPNWTPAGLALTVPPVACEVCGNLFRQSTASVLKKRPPVCGKCVAYRSWYERLVNDR